VPNCSTFKEAGGLAVLPYAIAPRGIRFIWKQLRQLPIIGVGGIFTAEDAWEKITAGASLVQVYTGWIYEGPLMVASHFRGVAAKVGGAGIGFHL
jgi:dihydroorotate dehydrogenase